MAGLPWLVVFGLIAAIAMWRSWGWLAVISLICLGMAMADTTFGSGLYGGATNLLATGWGAIVSSLNSVA